MWLLVLGILVVLILHYMSMYGLNATNMFFLGIMEKLRINHVRDHHRIYKTHLKTLSKSAFNRLKMRGTRWIERSALKVSRGYDKINEIMMETKLRPYGTVLSLCCGAGGWEQAIADYPAVEKIHSVTFGSGPGHVGHKNFSEKLYPGKSKVHLSYSDARVFPVTRHDWLLFDGGESHPDPDVEANKFNSLFSQTVMRQINANTKGFFLKILTPGNATTMDFMKRIQEITGKGCLMRLSQSRASTSECYFVSTKIVPVEKAVRLCMEGFIRRACETGPLKPLRFGPGYSYYREPVAEDLGEPLDYSASIEQCGVPCQEQGRNYNHWESRGVYPTGSEGSAGMKYVSLGMVLIRKLVLSLPGFSSWKLTDTTPQGFIGVFNAKVDTSPTENHEHWSYVEAVFEGVANSFLRRGFRYKEMNMDEVRLQANKQGAPGFQDKWRNVGEFLEDPQARAVLTEHEKALLDGKPLGGIFNTMGKREKKESATGPKGSRMVAYLPIPMRMIEMKAFGCLLKLTKPMYNRFGVGGLGLHDLGMRLKEVWLGHGLGTDIAGFDTRVSATWMKQEMKFLQRLGMGELGRQLYRLYMFPAIMIPIPSDFRRSELLFGRGQRMSGTNITYSMNTVSRLVLLLTQVVLAKKMNVGDVSRFVEKTMLDDKVKGVDGVILGGVISGDDEVTTGDTQTMNMVARSAHLLHDLGFPRKNIPREVIQPLASDVSSVEFCSHRYTRVTYYDSYNNRTVERYQPTRAVSEIVAKAVIRIGVGDELSDEAWLSAQGNNLLVNYHHLRTVRALGLAMKAAVNPNLILTEEGGFLRPTPWMRPGDILDVINAVLFGNSTHYPVPDFAVRSLSHLGYLSPRMEVAFDPEVFTKAREKWRSVLRYEVEAGIAQFATGGDVTVLGEWRRPDLY